MKDSQKSVLSKTFGLKGSNWRKLHNA